MDILLYSIFSILAFVFFGIALWSRIYLSDRQLSDMAKAGIPIIMLALCCVFFVMLALNSFNVQTTYCDPVINQTTSEVVGGNTTTTYTNAQLCTTEQNVYSYMSVFYWGLFLLTIGLIFVFALGAMMSK